eukprot:3794688-Amphidinium_carterae.3
MLSCAFDVFAFGVLCGTCRSLLGQGLGGKRITLLVRAFTGVGILHSISRRKCKVVNDIEE